MSFMNPAFNYQVLTPSHQLASGQAVYAQVPGQDGSFGVLAGHAPLVALLAENQPLIITEPFGTPKTFIVTGGVAEVTPEGLTILAEAATAA
jgi:F-type H+-transporting ATPase subunit epsilon